MIRIPEASMIFVASWVAILSRPTTALRTIAFSNNHIGAHFNSAYSRIMELDDCAVTTRNHQCLQFSSTSQRIIGKRAGTYRDRPRPIVSMIISSQVFFLLIQFRYFEDRTLISAYSDSGHNSSLCTETCAAACCVCSRHVHSGELKPRLFQLN